jgi:hypothetical protein
MHMALRDVLEIALPRGALLGNWPAIEALVEHFDDFGFYVEPLEDLVSLIAVVDAPVEFVPDFGGEVCDFTVACFHVYFGLVV